MADSLLDVLQRGQGLLHNPDLLAQQMQQRGMLALRPGGGVPPIPRTPPPIPKGSTLVSTRFPTGAERVADPLAVRLQSGDLPAYRASPGYEQNMSLIGTYPGFRHLRGEPAREVEKGYIDQATKNLMFLHERSPEVMKKASPLWYHGASRFVEDRLANRYGIPKEAAAAGTATLSPQMYWDKNASLAERVGDVIFSPVASKRMTTEMRDAFKTFGAATQANQANQLLMRKITGKKFSQLTDPFEQALWIRLYDRAHNPTEFRTIAPDGGLGPLMLNKDGTPAKISWGSLSEISKSVRAFTSGGDMSIISPALGNKHKVRNFYNDVQHPTRADAGVTGDTHQVAGAQLRPLSGESEAVGHHLGGVKGGQRTVSTSSVTGHQGTYPLVEAATRNVAKKTGLLAHEAQSSTWEPTRTLFSPGFKNPQNAARVDKIWREYDRGKITFKGAQEAILKLAGGIAEPGWARRGIGLLDPRTTSTYRK